MATAAADSALAADGIPATALAAYQRAAGAAPPSCHLTWTLLVAIGRVESDHGRFAGAVLHTDGRSTPPIIGPALAGAAGTVLIPDSDHGALDGDPVYDHAVGPMQFIPTTWAAYGRDGDGDGRADPFDIFDAAAPTAAYLCAAGGNLATPTGQAEAVLAYNHSASYLATVLGLAAAYAGTTPPPLPTPDTLPVPAQPPAAPAPPPALPMPPSGTPHLTAPTIGSAAAVPSPAPVPTPSTSRQPLAPTAAAPSTPSASPIVQPAPGATTNPTAPAPSTTTAPAPSTTSAAAPGPTAELTAPAGSNPSSAATGAAPTPTPPASFTTGQSCPARGTTVYLLNGTADPTTAEQAAAALTAAGLTIGATTTDPTATSSAIEYAATDQAAAQALAATTSTEDLLHRAPVRYLTIVLGAHDSSTLLTDLQRLVPACR